MNLVQLAAAKLVGQASNLARSAGFQPAARFTVQARCLHYLTARMAVLLLRCREAHR